MMIRHIVHAAAWAALVLLATTAAEAKQFRIDSRVAGTTVWTQGEGGGGEGDFVASTKGAPGKSHRRAFTVYGPNQALSPECQGQGFVLELPLVTGASASVSTFEDLSQLHALATSGYVCVRNDGSSKFFTEYDIVGGTGRFEGATGTMTFTGEGVVVGTDVRANWGTLTGTATVGE